MHALEWPFNYDSSTRQYLLPSSNEFFFLTPPPSQDTEGCMGEQASLEFDLTFGDVLLPELVQAY